MTELSSVASFFRIIMPSVIHENKLASPEKFSAKYGDELSKFVKLTVPAGGIWFGCSSYNASTEYSNKVSKRRTREVTSVKLGDQFSAGTEALELDSADDLNQETTSKRAKFSSGNYLDRRTAQGRKRALNAAKLYKSGNPLFVLPLKTYHVHRSYIVDSDNKKWPMYCGIRNGRVISLSNGWSDFVKKRGLNAGDVCVFESIQTNKEVLKVTEFRARVD